MPINYLGLFSVQTYYKISKTFSKIILLFNNSIIELVFTLMILYFKVGQKIRNWITEPNPIWKNSIESEPKFIKYPNGFQILVFRKLKPNLTKPNYFGYQNISEIDLFPYIYINFLLDLMYIKNNQNI